MPTSHGCSPREPQYHCLNFVTVQAQNIWRICSDQAAGATRELRNTGGEKITELALEFWRNKKKREDIKLSDVESHLSKLSFDIQGGFWHCSLIDRNLIDVFVPFLPLEEEHVRMCVRAELRQRDRTINEELVTKIAGEMSYYPERERVCSVKGCKTVATKISLFL
ncbi:torsin-1A-like [Bufo bufo]|uniref:torsin-1A-like n=1 Tax=Bufo bufo TaxID=8384 RepID=UPI001ABEC824|nr:torsin-1A-like [Bufo bufo]